MHHYDIFAHICNFLNDIEKINLTATSKVTDQFKNKLLFGSCYYIQKIRDLPFYDNFINVRTDCVERKIPKNSKSLFMECCRDCTHGDLIMLSPNLQNVTHLTLYQKPGYPDHRYFCERLMSTECYI